MTSTPLHYVRRKRGNLFWEPTPAMRAKGFLPKPLGPETPESIAEAKRLYQSWQTALQEGVKITSWPAGTLGAYFDRMKRTSKWAKKKPRTREDYERAWPHLQGLAPKILTRITVEDVERLSDDLEASHGPHERYRTIKSLRSIYSDAIYRLKLIGYPSPAKGIPNPQPKGRSAIWLGAEVPLLVAKAEELGYRGMAVAIRIDWDTLFSPVDVRTIQKGWIKHDQTGRYVELGEGRTKTSKAAFGHLSPATVEALDTYLEGLGFELPAEGLIIRQRNGHAYRSKDTFGDDFRSIRKAAFPGDTRQFQDLRRSGNVEADAAGADKQTMAAILANTMDTSKFLDETYTPPTVAKAREVAAQRLIGRARLAGEITRIKRSDSQG